MPFTSLDYIVFFSVVFFGYYTLPCRFRWMFLLVASWMFYGWMSPWYLIFLAVTTTVTYVAAVGMSANYFAEKAWISANKGKVDRETKKAYKALMERRRWWMGCGAVAALLSMLVVFKYLEFLLANIFWLGGAVGLDWQSSAVRLILPIGLSFYVFQGIAYVIDVQRGEAVAERNFFKHALFVSYFPQIMQGPIGNYGRLASQLFGRHDFDYEQTVFGIQRVAWGFFKKFMVANMIGARIDGVWICPAGHEGLFCWTIICTLYAIQIYADFSGYMDIACGCSQMLGIRLDENFDCPYLSRSVPEFWRRWHMTLSSWFKDYLFYPLLRSDWNMRIRKRLYSSRYLSNAVPTALALAVVWAATGLWHGANWGYVAWGGYYGFFMIANVVLHPTYDAFARQFPRWTASRFHSIFRMARTFAIVVVGYSIFKPGDLSVTWNIWKLSLSGDWLRGVHTLPHNGKCSWMFIGVMLSILIAVDVLHYFRGSGTIRVWLRRRPVWFRWSVYLGGVWSVVYLGLYGSGFDQFEYFKF